MQDGAIVTDACKCFRIYNNTRTTRIAYYSVERERETWEYETYFDGELCEMIDIFTGKGMSEKDAEAMLRILAKYKEPFIGKSTHARTYNMHT